MGADLIAAYANYRDAARFSGDPKRVDTLWREVLRLEKAVAAQRRQAGEVAA